MNTFPQNIKTICPSCNAKWSPKHHHHNRYKHWCSKCLLHYMPGSNELCLDLGIDSNTDPLYIYWQPVFDCCIYGCGKYQVQLPWLPYTITKVDLDKYLVLF